MFWSLRHLVGWIVSALGSRKDRILENLALRQQLLAVEPVKAILSTFGFFTRASPSDPPGPVTRLYTPSGMPASRTTCARAKPVRGVSETGL